MAAQFFVFRGCARMRSLSGTNVLQTSVSAGLRLELGDGRRGRDPFGHLLGLRNWVGASAPFDATWQMSQEQSARVPAEGSPAGPRLNRSRWPRLVGYSELCEHPEKVGVANGATQPPRRLPSPTPAGQLSRGTTGSRDSNLAVTSV